MKRKKIATVLAVSAMMLFTALPVQAQYMPNQITQQSTGIIMDVLPHPLSRVTGSKTTSKLPKNIDGNQGLEVYSETIGSSHVNGSYRVKVSNFSDGMTSVNMAVYAGSEHISGQMDMTTTDEVTFTIPSDAKGESLRIVMSTSSTNRGTCGIKVENN